MRPYSSSHRIILDGTLHHWKLAVWYYMRCVAQQPFVAVKFLRSLQGCFWSFSIPAMYNYRFNVDADNETAAILGFVFFDVPLANDGGL